MFLNKKAITKVWLITGGYITVAALCFLLGILCMVLEAEYIHEFILGGLCLAMTPLIYKLGYYTEGKGKLLNEGNKLICRQLKPAEFIRLYEQKRDDPTNEIAKPDYQVLQMLVVAYDALDDRSRALETMDQALAIVPEKHRNQALIIKCDLLFNYGRLEAAEALYQELAIKDLDVMSKSLLDAVMKSDRAMLLGDDTTAEAYYRQALTRSFPKPTPLAILYAHYHLARICERTGRHEEALEHANYCINHGGETGTQHKAASGEIFT